MMYAGVGGIQPACLAMSRSSVDTGVGAMANAARLPIELHDVELLDRDTAARGLDPEQRRAGTWVQRDAGSYTRTPGWSVQPLRNGMFPSRSIR